MDTKEIKELLKAFDESGSSYFQIKQDGIEIKFKKPEDKASDSSNVYGPFYGSLLQQPEENKPEGAPAPIVSMSSKKAQEPGDGQLVLAPLVGVFYSAPSPEEKPYVQVGDKVKEGQVLCLIEAMKMMSEITSPKDGVIKDIYAKNQDVVGFEDQLFLIGD